MPIFRISSPAFVNLLALTLAGLGGCGGAGKGAPAAEGIDIAVASKHGAFLFFQQ